MQEDPAAWRATGAELLRPYFLGLLAEQCGKVGRFEKGLVLLDEAIAVVNKSAERFSEAELYRLRGTLLRNQGGKSGIPGSRSDSEAENSFQKALFIARQQGAKSWELRAATSLAQLWLQQDKRAEARRLLTEVVEWFSEGLRTPDLQTARTLLADVTHK